jgi:hypothetical protein
VNHFFSAVFSILIMVYLIFMLNRFVSAHEKISKELENLNRRLPRMLSGEPQETSEWLSHGSGI